MTDPFGLDLIVELHRIWILVIIDISTRAVLGYSLGLGKEYNADDIADAIQNALTPHKKRTPTIPGLSYRPQGGFPSSAYPLAEYACWDSFRLDNAKAHLAESTLWRLTEIVGCWPDIGPVRQPNQRPYIERFFNLIAEHFAHRVTGSTGNDPNGIIRKLADPKGDLSLLMRLDELEELIDVVISDYNGEPHDGIGGRTPLEAMDHLLKKEEGMVRHLAIDRRNKLCLLQDARFVTIRGSLERAVRPYINLAGVRYSSDLLSSNPSLLGKKLRIYFSVKDVRFVHAFFEDGTELGILMAARPWCFTPHSLRIRQEILRLKRMNKLAYGDEEDPLSAYVKYKRLEASKNKKAANDLAKVNAILKAPTANLDGRNLDRDVITTSLSREEAGTSSEQARFDDAVKPNIKPLQIKRRRIQPVVATLDC